MTVLNIDQSFKRNNEVDEIDMADADAVDAEVDELIAPEADDDDDDTADNETSLTRGDIEIAVSATPLLVVIFSAPPDTPTTTPAAADTTVDAVVAAAASLVARMKNSRRYPVRGSTKVSYFLAGDENEQTKNFKRHEADGYAGYMEIK
ncbi:hypothetical protein HDU76_013660 [Blyttiomyces sp. JEL0837]|nr:hypothetical protein HDU76_013660 [Blyttiomyces sp. JEL0837]